MTMEDIVEETETAGDIEFRRMLQEPNGSDWDERKAEYEPSAAEAPY